MSDYRIRSMTAGHSFEPREYSALDTARTIAPMYANRWQAVVVIEHRPSVDEFWAPMVGERFEPVGGQPQSSQAAGH